MTRPVPSPSDSLGRFIQGIYGYYMDKGFPNKTAKAKMVDDTMNELVNLLKAEKEVPDELVVLLCQQVSRALYQRGNQITKQVKQQAQAPAEETLQVLRLLKETTMQLDTFVSTYTGWSDTNGEKTN